MRRDTGDPIERTLSYLREQHPRSARGVEEAIAVAPERFQEVAGRWLGWLAAAFGEEALPRAVDSFARFSTDVNLHQARYEAEGAYENKSFQEVYEAHYSRSEAMTDYLLGVYLINFLWAHHMEITLFFEDRFLARLREDGALVEIAPGHGGWGVSALNRVPGTSLRAFDISPASIEIASSIARAAGVGGRASYLERDAMDLDSLEPESADGLICSFLIEHLEDPGRLLAVIQRILKPGARAFLTGALTAAQIDHIFEFKRESELLRLAEDNGLRVLETLSAAPRRRLPRSRFLPRAMALLLERPAEPVWG